MKKVISLLVLLGLLVSVTVAFSSCGKESEPIGGGAQISVYLGGEITDLNPQKNQTNDATLSIIRLVFEPLFSIAQNGELELAGAKSYKIDKSAGKVTINLRESYWSDRTTLVRASDYVEAWKDLISPTSDEDYPTDAENPAATLLYDVKNAMDIKKGEKGIETLGVKVVDNDTLEITFEEGFTAYELFLRNLANVALSPINTKSVLNNETYWAKSVTTILTNGPFRVSELDLQEGSFRLERNLTYHRAADSSAPADKYVVPAALKTLWNVNLTIEDDEYVESLIDRLAEKTVFYVGEIPQSVREAKKSQTVITDTLSTYTYLFNCANPLFSTATVRKLLSDVLDREAIAAIAVYGKPATGLIPQTVSEGETFNAWKATNPLSITAEKTPAEAKAELNAVERLLTINPKKSVDEVADAVKAIEYLLSFAAKDAEGTVDLETVKELLVLAEQGAKRNDERKAYVATLNALVEETEGMIELGAFVETVNAVLEDAGKDDAGKVAALNDLLADAEGKAGLEAFAEAVGTVLADTKKSDEEKIEAVTPLAADAEAEAEAGTGLETYVKTVGELLASSEGDIDFETVKVLLPLALTDDDGNFVSFGAFNLTYKAGTVNQLIAEYVKGVWDDVGFTVTLDPVDKTSRTVTQGDVPLTVYDDDVEKKYENRDYDVLAIDYQMLSTNALPVLATFTATMNGCGMYAVPIVEGENKTLEQLINNDNTATYVPKPNRMNYVSNGRNEHKMALYDSKILKAYNAKNLDQRNKLLHEAEGILLNEMPAIPLLFNQRAYIVSSELSGLTVDRFGYVSFTRCEQKDYEKYLTELPAETTEVETGTVPATEAVPVDTTGDDGED